MPSQQQKRAFNPLKPMSRKNPFKDVTTLPFRGIATLYDVRGRKQATLNVGADARKKGFSLGIKF